MGLMNKRIVEEGEEIALLRIGHLVAIIENVPNNSDLGSLCVCACALPWKSVRITAAADAAGGVGRAAVLVHVQEYIPFDPCIRAIDVKAIVIASGDHIVDEMHDRVSALA